MVAALVFFFANTLPISVVIALTEGKSSRKVWSECYFWSFPYYLVGAAAVGPRRNRQPAGGMANLAAGSAADLLGLSLLSPLSGTSRGGERDGSKSRSATSKRSPR